MSTQREVLQQAAPAVTDWDVRGELAKSLTCWHRLTGQEAAELVTLYQRLSAPQQEVQEPVAWGAFYFGGSRNGKLYSHCDTQAQIEAYIADRHQSDDSNTFRAAPLYTAPPQRHPHRTVTYVCPVCAASLERQG